MSDEPEYPATLEERARSAAEGTNVALLSHLSRVEKRHVIGERTADQIAKLSTAQKEPIDPTNVMPTAEEDGILFDRAQAVVPPYDPGTLVMIYEDSSALEPNVESYKTNIDAFGHRFDPVIDLEANDAKEKIGDAMFLERLHASSGEGVPQAAYPTDDEIANRTIEIKHLMRLERARLEVFFDEAVPGSSFVELRQQTRSDIEITGNAYWEAIRNGRRELAQFTYAPSHSIRLLPVELSLTDVREPSRISPITFEKTTRRRRFRRFVQVVNAQVVYFKEFGDPRVMSSRRGVYYESFEAFQKEEPNVPEATELIHFRVFSSRSPYGVPRWIGTLLSVLGSRASEEVNYLYFDNKAVPPLAILVSGGKIAADAKVVIQEYVSKQLKGRNNFHKILIIEAESSGPQQGTTGANRVRMELKPLTEAQQQDALFQKYDERNTDKVGAAFRMPRLLRGDVRDFNKGTAEASLQFAEMQVFQPERSRFDGFVNRHVLPSLDCRFWKFVSLTPVSKDPTTMAEIITKLVTANVMTPGEARVDAGQIVGRELKAIDDDWTKIPVQLLLAGLLPKDGDDGEDLASAAPVAGAPAASKPLTREQQMLAAVASNLSQLRDRLRGAEAKSAASETAKAERHAFDEGEVIELRVPKAVIDSWFESEPDGDKG